MKRIAPLCAMLIVCLFPALLCAQDAAKGTTSKAPGVEQQLKQIEDEWSKAIMSKDAATLKRIIAEDWVVTTIEGKVENRQTSISKITSSTDVITAEENFDMQVRVFGTTAVVVGGSKESGTRQGTAYTETYRWTDVFVKHGTTWQAVVSQDLKLP